MTSFKRKLKRKASVNMAKYLKKNMKSIIQEKLESKLSGINKVPDKCDVCAMTFDKTDKEQVFSWMLRVNQEDEKYDLFCPGCYGKYFDEDTRKEVQENV